MDEDTDYMYLKRLKVFNLPDRITEAELRQIFSNQKKNGGGPIQEMIMYSNNIERYAIITFEHIGAVTTIMSRGNTVPVLDSKLRVEPFLKCELNLLEFQPNLNYSETEGKTKMKSLKQSELKSEEECSSLLSKLNLDDKCSFLLSQSKPVDEVLHSHSEVVSEVDFVHLHSEVKPEMGRLNSISEVKSEIAMTLDDDVLKRTIKAGICKRNLSKQYYELYLEDIGFQDYEYHSMMLDGLHKNVYVTFQEEADANKFCRMLHDVENSNITNVSLTTKDDFNTYNNRIFLLGSKVPQSEKLKKLLKEKTEIEVKEIIENREQNAVVVVFDERICIDITPLTWELTNLNGVKMITAPVIRENALFVSGLNDIPKSHLERYMKNKKHSGGGPLKSVELVGDNQALAVFENETDLEDFTNKGSHELEGCKLEVSVFHSCLKQTYLQKLISRQEIKGLNKNKPSDNLSSDFSKSTEPANHQSPELAKLNKPTDPKPSEFFKSSKSADVKTLELPKSNETADHISSGLPKSSKSTDHMSSELSKSSKSADHMSSEIPESNKRNESNSHKKRTESDKSETEKEIQLKSEEYFLLEKSNVLKKLGQKKKDFKLIFDHENCKIVLRGNDVSSLANMEIEILKFCKSNIENISLNDLSDDVKKFMELENVREKLNSILHHGYLKFSSGDIELFFLKSKDSKHLISHLKELIFIHRKKLNSESVSALQTLKGKMFLSGIDINSNLKSCVHLDVDGKTLVILGPENEAIEIEREVDNFFEKFNAEKVEFPGGKMMFASSHMQEEIKSLLIDTGTHMKSANNFFIISGFKEDVEKCKIRLIKICDKICRESVTLKFDGVNEFMTDPEGQSILQDLEIKNKSIIIFNNEASPSRQDRAAIERSSSQDSREWSVVEREEKLKKDTAENNSQIKVNFGKIEVILEEGEIDKQTTDMIVITVDKSLDLRKRRISKILLDKAGEQIQQELKSKKMYGLEPGEFARTSGGRLQCNHIVYACLPPLKDHVDSTEYKKALSNMKRMIVNILYEAYHCKVKTISIPSLGTGHLGFPPSTSAKVIVDAINEFSSICLYSPVVKIKLVVFPTDKDVMKAFRPIVLSKGKDIGSPTDDSINAIKEGKSCQYGDIKLKIEQGDITKESQCEAFVIGIKDSMNLLSSGKVCSALNDFFGPDLQKECNRKKDEIKQNGVVMTSAPGLKCKKIFFISQDKFTTHWDDGILQVLKEADRAGIKSLALPALGAGLRQPDLKKIKTTILAAIEKFSRCQKKQLNFIKLIIFDKKTLECFLETDQELKMPINDKQKEARLHQSKLSKDVVLDVYSDNMQNIAATQSALEEICQKNFKETIFQSDCIHLLNKNNIEELESFGLEHKMKMTIYLDDNKVTIKGFNHEGIQEIETKLKVILKKFETERAIKNRAKEPSVIWQYEKHDGWHNFEPLLNCELEQVFQKGSLNHVITDVRGESFSIDFQKYRQYTLDRFGTRLSLYHNIRRNCKQSEVLFKKDVDTMTEKKMLAESYETNKKGAMYTLKEPVIIWQYKCGDQWSSFDSWSNRKLEEEFKKNTSFCNIKHPSGDSFAVDLKKGIFYSFDFTGSPIQICGIQRVIIPEN
ncbi:hypothetical protein Btru_004404 [Bulinus truncatus]|nr:hypothetical protein Btru_004404 [Bulinus truncatus]